MSFDPYGHEDAFYSVHGRDSGYAPIPVRPPSAEDIAALEKQREAALAAETQATSNSLFGGANPNGALSSMPSGILDPRAMALFGLAQGLFKAGAPSAVPTGFGGALSSGLQGGMQGLVQGHQIQQQQAYRQAQMKQMEAQARAAEARLNQPRIVPPGGSMVGPDNKPVFTAPFKPEPTKESPLAQLLRERDALSPEDPRRPAYEDAIKRQSTHQPPIATVTLPPQEKKFDEAVGKEFGEQYAGLMKADMNAPANVAKYQRLGQLLKQAGTGKFTSTTTDIKAMAKGLGIDLNSMGVADNVAPAQAATALANQLALELRSPAGGAGMPGALSDQDRQFLLQMVPSLESDPNAWPKMIEYRVKLAQREQQVAKMARAYRKKSGRYDEGFYDELQEWSNKNPLFPEVPKAPSGEGWGIQKVPNG
jgi:hypothetical protein